MNNKDNSLKRLSSAALAVTMAAAMAIPGFADPYYGENLCPHNTEQQESMEEEQDCNISFYMRTGDRGDLEFSWAKGKMGAELGLENVPMVQIPEGWYLDGYYLKGQKLTAYELSQYRADSQTMEIEVRTYPNANHKETDDREAQYEVSFFVRRGDRGTLTSDTVAVTGYGNYMKVKDIPVLIHGGKGKYKIKGYFVDGEKYSRHELAELPITGDLEVEVRTYLNADRDREDGMEEEHSLQWDDRTEPTWNRPSGNSAFDPFGVGVGSGYNSYYGHTMSSYMVGQQGQAVLTLIPQNGQAPQKFTVYPNLPIMAPAAPKCQGYQFVGWSTDQYGRDGLWDFSRGIPQNTTLYGVWVRASSQTLPEYNFVGNHYPGSSFSSVTTINTSTKGYVYVTLITNNDQIYNPVPVKQGNRLKIDGTPVREGYRFVGWAKDEYGDELWNFSKDTAEEDLSLYAVWTER